jgi:hypothetical protein
VHTFAENAGSHRVRRLAIREILAKLEHRHQRQPPRRETRLPLGRIQIGKIVIAKHRAEFLT